jgi:putative membrane protein
MVLQQRQQWAVGVALLFHVSGAIGILCTPYKNWFVQNTPVNLLLMAVLLFVTQPGHKGKMMLFAAIAFAGGMAAEITGVNTGLLFGSYHYGSVMGMQLKGVPLLIGVQWFVVVFTSAIIINRLHHWIEQQYHKAGLMPHKTLMALSSVADAALLATFFDYVMEPVAVKLGFWYWHGGGIPLYNYVCWFAVSALQLWILRLMPVQHNRFAVHLFIIQLLFFIVLRTAL